MLGRSSFTKSPPPFSWILWGYLRWALQFPPRSLGWSRHQLQASKLCVNNSQRARCASKASRNLGFRRWEAYETTGGASTVSHGLHPPMSRKKSTVTLPETNIAHENPIFPGKYHQNCGFSMAMLVSGSVFIYKAIHRGYVTLISKWYLDVSARKWW